MGRRSALVLVGSLVFALAACGGDDGGGDDSAFCDSLEVLSDQVADGDLASNNGLEDAVDTANDLLEAANSDQEDAVTEVGEVLADADADDAADTAETIQDELGDLADDCEIDEFAEAPDDTTTTTSEPDETTTTGGDATTTTGGGDSAGDLNPVTRVFDPAVEGIVIDAGYEEAADLCFRGLMQACDDIFFGSEDGLLAPAAQGSDTLSYGGSCGGRILDFVNDTQRCVDNIFGAAPFDVTDFTDPSFEGPATSCSAGDMQSCDNMFRDTSPNTAEELYGNTCGGRIDPAVAVRGASCVSIFGATAEFG